MFKKPLYLVILGLILVAIFFSLKQFLGKENLEVNKNSTINTLTDTSFTNQLEKVKKTLDSASHYKIDSLENQFSNSDKSKSVLALQGAINFWDDKGKISFSSYYAKNLATSTNTEENWISAGKRFVILSQYFPEDKILLIQEAKDCFNNALKVNSNSTSAEVSLASIIVEEGKTPMVGITKLMKVVEKDSNNIEANFSLGYFSMKSGQFDKAIKRFEKIISIDSEYFDAYIYLSDAYTAIGSKNKAVEILKVLERKSTNLGFKKQIQDKIEQILKN